MELLNISNLLSDASDFKFVIRNRNIVNFQFSLTFLYITHDKFVSMNNVLREYNGSKQDIKKSRKSLWCTNKYGWYKQKIVWKKCWRNNSREW